MFYVLFSPITNSFIAHSSSTIEEVRYSAKVFYLIYILVTHVYTTSGYCIQGISIGKNAVQAAYNVRADVKTFLCKGQGISVQKYHTVRTYRRQDCTHGLHWYCKEIKIHAEYLTLRLLMSYIYIYIYIYIYMEHPFLMFLDHTQRRTTVGRTPLDE